MPYKYTQSMFHTTQQGYLLDDFPVYSREDTVASKSNRIAYLVIFVT